jgi:hypothetical protein
MNNTQMDQHEDEVQGYDVTSGGIIPAGTPKTTPLQPYNPANPAAGGWDGVGLRYVAPVTYTLVTGFHPRFPRFPF